MFGQETTPDRLRIKICGITNTDDAIAAQEFGADAIGLNCFRGSKRYVDLQRAGDWIAALPSPLIKVAIVVNASFDDALAISSLPFITALQLHGQETAEICTRLAAAGVRFGKAVAVSAETSLLDALEFSTDTIVLDSMANGAFGGTGEPFPWEIARQFVQAQPSIRAILAGGLNPENVAAAVRQVRPFGVDVTTGVESAPGRKNRRALKRFIDTARAS